MKKIYILILIILIIVGVIGIGVFFSIQKIKSGWGNPSLTILWERIIGETPQAKISAYLRSVMNNHQRKALAVWQLQGLKQGADFSLDPSYNFYLLTQRREEITKDLISKGIKDFKILKTEWWRTCCEPDIISNFADAGGARTTVQLTDKNGSTYNYIFDVFHRETSYWGAAEGYRPRQWVLRDAYPENDQPLFWTTRSSDQIIYVSSYSPLRPGIDYRLEIPASWRGKYEVEENNNYSDFIYSGNPEQKYSLFRIYTLKKDEWEQAKNEPGYHGEELGAENDLIFVLSRSLDNPYIGNYAEEYQRMAGDINDIVKTFLILR